MQDREGGWEEGRQDKDGEEDRCKSRNESGSRPCMLPLLSQTMVARDLGYATRPYVPNCGVSQWGVEVSQSAGGHSTLLDAEQYSTTRRRAGMHVPPHDARISGPLHHGPKGLW